MRKIVSFFHISLDGFVSGPNGEMNWIKVDEEIFDYGAKRIVEGDTALYGRKTYEMMESYWPTAADKPDASKHDLEHSKWYAAVRKVVLSQTLKNPNADTVVISDNLVEEITALKKTAGNDILIFGSPQATHALMRENLIDGYWLFVNPVVLGKGVRLFSDVNEQIDLKLVSTHSFSSGVTELNYVVVR